MNYEAILFDFDGVLIDSEPVHWLCWNEILAPFGGHIDWKTYTQHCIGVSDRAMIAALCEQSTPQLPFEEIWAQYPKKKDLFRSRMSREDAIAQEVRSLLAQLKDRYRVAVVTSSGQREVEPILELTGIRPFLETVVYGGDVARLKPAPDPYLLAAVRMSVTNALVVEDSDAGLEAGRAAGFEVLHVPAAGEMCDLVRRKLGL